MKKHLYEKSAHRIAELAGKALSLVLSDPQNAYAMAIARKLRTTQIWGYSCKFDDPEVGAALRQLRQQGYLTSEEVDHPDKSLIGRPRVILYTLTPHGMFILSLAKAMVPPQGPIARAA